MREILPIFSPGDGEAKGNFARRRCVCSPPTFTLCTLPPRYEFTSKLQSRDDRPTLILDHLSSSSSSSSWILYSYVLLLRSFGPSDRHRTTVARDGTKLGRRRSFCCVPVVSRGVLGAASPLKLARPISGVASTVETRSPFKKSRRV